MALPSRMPREEYEALTREQRAARDAEVAAVTREDFPAEFVTAIETQLLEGIQKREARQATTGQRRAS